MKRIAFALIVTFLLFACANNLNYENKLNDFVGQDENVLISEWGKPTSQKILSDQEKIMTYIKINDWYVPTEYYFINDDWGVSDPIYNPYFNEYNFAPYSELVDTEVENICQTSFWIKDGIITSYKWRGNNCF